MTKWGSVSLNLTSLGLNMATKMPHSKKSWYECGYWFTLANLVKRSSKNELTVQSNSLGGINIMVYQGNTFMKGVLTLTPLPPRRTMTVTRQTYTKDLVGTCLDMWSPSVSLNRIFFLKTGSMPLPGKMVSTNMRVLQRGFLFLFVH